MIYVDRNRTDETGKEIRPSDSWFKNAAKETKKALKEKENHNANRSVYGHVSVRAALEKLFIYKCAYCECSISPGFDWDVEHFRPKGSVSDTDSPDHPGYYWLTYTWGNLFPSCTHCNQKRLDKPAWGESGTLPAKGKADQFPLVSEATRAMSPEDDIDREHTLLIDPTYDDPAWYLGFDPKGNIFALDENQYGDKTIEVFNLKRRSLVRARRILLNNLDKSLSSVDKLPLDSKTKLEFKRELLINNSRDKDKYAGMVRQYAEILGISLE